MKRIELVPALELGNKLNVDVMDFSEDAGAEPETGRAEPDARGAELCAAGADPGTAGADPGAAGKETETADTVRAAAPAGPRRKRCGITLDYAPRDVRELKAQGMDREAMLAYYRQRIYDLVKVNIAQDWVCTGGMEEVLAIVAKHLDAAR